MWVINDPLGHIHSPSSSERYSLLKFVFLEWFWKVGTDGHHLWKLWSLPTMTLGRPRGSMYIKRRISPPLFPLRFSLGNFFTAQLFITFIFVCSGGIERGQKQCIYSHYLVLLDPLLAFLALWLKSSATWIYSSSFDPRGRPTVTTGSDNCFAHVVR